MIWSSYPSIRFDKLSTGSVNCGFYPEFIEGQGERVFVPLVVSEAEGFVSNHELVADQTHKIALKEHIHKGSKG